MVDSGIEPNQRLSSELVRLSPITQTSPSGITHGSSGGQVTGPTGSVRVRAGR